VQSGSDGKAESFDFYGDLMNRTVGLMVGLITSLAATSWVAAESKATLEDTHLCCKSCVTDAGKAVASVDGATAVCDPKAKSITITAPDAATAQKAMDALEAAGFYGKATGAELKDDSGAPKGNVKSLTLTGLHNCCKKCATAINATIKKVPGATGEVEPKVDSVTVTGDFDAGKLVQAFEDAGFHVKAEAK
jgi:mercuric ion binding protein